MRLTVTMKRLAAKKIRLGNEEKVNLRQADLLFVPIPNSKIKFQFLSTEFVFCLASLPVFERMYSNFKMRLA
jgi:hypothetical protein